MSDATFDLYVAKKMAAKAQNARDRGIEFNLTFAGMRNLLKAKRCFYTGLPMTKPGSAKQIATDLTIDRVDASKGYVTGNVVACCYAANQLKSQVESAGMAGLKMGERVFSRSIKRMGGVK
jgi:repressor of nif and glnA expression